jgi:hypothetical protein
MKKLWDSALPAARDFVLIFDLRIFDSRSSLLQDFKPGLSKVGATGFGRILKIQRPRSLE